MNDLNLFATVLTHAAPSSNYRGESEENRTVLQKISKGGHEYTVISPESMRNALREQLALKNLPLNRRRLHDEEQLAVEYKSFPDAEKFADDFLFGFMVADTKAIKDKANANKPSKRDSVLRMNLAVALTPYRFNATFHQSPLHAGESAFKNASTSALLHREVAHTAYQYPFALALGDVRAGQGPKWTRALLESIGELSNVAVGHARSLFEMAPKSIVVRLTKSLVAGYDTYGFDETGSFRDLERVSDTDLPGNEFWVGGEIVRAMPDAERKRLTGLGVHLFENPQKLISAVAAEAKLGEA